MIMADTVTTADSEDTMTFLYHKDDIVAIVTADDCDMARTWLQRRFDAFDIKHTIRNQDLLPVIRSHRWVRILGRDERRWKTLDPVPPRESLLKRLGDMGDRILTAVSESQLFRAALVWFVILSPIIGISVVLTGLCYQLTTGRNPFRP